MWTFLARLRGVAYAIFVVVAGPLGAQPPEAGAPPTPASAASPAVEGATSDGTRLFLEAWRITQLAFYDPKMHGVDWDAVRDELLPRAHAARDSGELSAVINEALSRLHASHTAHYTRDQREYYEILDVFWPHGVPEHGDSAIRPGPVEYVGVGLVARVIDGRTFAADVYDAGPAAAAGIQVGDELVGILLDDDTRIPWSDIAPFRGREGKPTRIVVRRTPGPESLETVTVVPERIHPREMYLKSMRAGARIIEKGGRAIAYARVRSYANVAYHDQLKELLAGKLADADALVLDIRDGWGGASPSYMDIFNPAAPTLALHSRDGTVHRSTGAWGKPTAVLIDGGSRSGKEMLAYAMKKHHVATLVGERTAGAVLGGTVRPLSDGSILFIAVADVDVDGERLEGIGVEPDVRVERLLPYCHGRDEQLDAAVEVLLRQLAEPKPR
jgi:carboxyl-terminal processing protease